MAYRLIDLEGLPFTNELLTPRHGGCATANRSGSDYLSLLKDIQTTTLLCTNLVGSLNLLWSRHPGRSDSKFSH